MSSKKMRRAFVSLPDGVWKIIDDDFRGHLGDGDSEVIRNMVIAYLSDKGYFMNERGSGSITEMNDKLFIVDRMISALIKVLEQKGTITYHEWDNMMRKQIAESTTNTAK